MYFFTGICDTFIIRALCRFISKIRLLTCFIYTGVIKTRFCFSSYDVSPTTTTFVEKARKIFSHVYIIRIILDSLFRRRKKNSEFSVLGTRYASLSIANSNGVRGWEMGWEMGWRWKNGNTHFYREIGTFGTSIWFYFTLGQWLSYLQLLNDGRRIKHKTIGLPIFQCLFFI